MEVCPNAALHESPVARQFEEMVRTLMKVVSQQTGAESLSLEAIESVLVATLCTVGCAALKAAMERMEATAVADRDGEALNFVLRGERRYMSRLGPVTVARSLYRAPGRNPPTVCPLEQQAGAARVANIAIADLTATDAQRWCAAMGLMCPSASSLGRIPATVSGLWEAGREAHETLLREQLVVPQAAATVCVSVDGVLVPMKAQTTAQAQARAAQQAAPGKHASGPSGYREVGCGTLSVHDHEGERLQPMYQARMPVLMVDTLQGGWKNLVKKGRSTRSLFTSNRSSLSREQSISRSSSSRT